MTEHQNSAIPKTKDAKHALSALMRLASKSEKSSGDALRLMQKWGVPQADRQGVLAELVRLKFIDDRRYAEAYVREKMNFSNWGVFKIRSMLSSKGIPREIIEDVLAQDGNSDKGDKLYNVLRKKALSVKAENKYELRTKLFRYAMSLGYAYDEVMECVDKVAEEV